MFWSENGKTWNTVTVNRADLVCDLKKPHIETHAHWKPWHRCSTPQHVHSPSHTHRVFYESERPRKHSNHSSSESPGSVPEPSAFRESPAERCSAGAPAHTEQVFTDKQEQNEHTEGIFTAAEHQWSWQGRATAAAALTSVPTVKTSSRMLSHSLCHIHNTNYAGEKYPYCFWFWSTPIQTQSNTCINLIVSNFSSEDETKNYIFRCFSSFGK